MELSLGQSCSVNISCPLTEDDLLTVRQHSLVTYDEGSSLGPIQALPQCPNRLFPVTIQTSRETEVCRETGNTPRGLLCSRPQLLPRPQSIGQRRAAPGLGHLGIRAAE